jgi:hypothetical protein
VPPMRVPITLDLHVTAFNFPDVPPERLFEHLADMAKTAEDNGFGSVSVMDHLHQIPPMGPQELNMLEGNMALPGSRPGLARPTWACSWAA